MSPADTYPELVTQECRSDSTGNRFIKDSDSADCSRVKLQAVLETLPVILVAVLEQREAIVLPSPGEGMAGFCNPYTGVDISARGAISIAAEGESLR